MPPKKRTGRATAEAAYAELMKESTTLVGNVGADYEAYVTALADAAAKREKFEESRAAAVKAGAITNEQLDQLGYRRTQKLPTLSAAGSGEPAPKSDKPAKTSSGSADSSPSNDDSDTPAAGHNEGVSDEHNQGSGEPALAAAGHNGGLG